MNASNGCAGRSCSPAAPTPDTATQSDAVPPSDAGAQSDAAPQSDTVAKSDMAAADAGGSADTADAAVDAGPKCTVATAAKDCDDGLFCTADLCDPIKGCQHEAKKGACDDGDKCTTKDQCVGNKCVGLPAQPTVTCNDGNACTIDGCDKAKGCTHKAATAGSACKDNNPCTTGKCKDGSCASVPLPPEACDDGDPCTQDGCYPGAGCTHAKKADGVACDLASGCVGVAACKAGKCTAKSGRLFFKGLGGSLSGSATPAGGVLVSRSLTAGPSTDQRADGVLTLLDAGGGEVWTRKWAAPKGKYNALFLSYAVALPGGQIGTVGHKRSPKYTSGKVTGFKYYSWSMRLDAKGNKLPANTIATISAVSTAGIVVGGKDTSIEAINAQNPLKKNTYVYVAARGLDGNKSGWTWSPGQKYESRASDMAGFGDGGVVVGGSITPGKTNDPWVVKLKDNKLLWQRTWPTSGTDRVRAVAAMADGSVVVLNSLYKMIRLQPDGQTAWTLPSVGTKQYPSMLGLPNGDLMAFDGERLSRLTGGGAERWFRLKPKTPVAPGEMALMPYGDLLIAGINGVSRLDRWGHSACSTSGACIDKKQADCNDGSGCTDQGCDAGKCTNKPIKSGCDAGKCSALDSCDKGKCKSSGKARLFDKTIAGDATSGEVSSTIVPLPNGGMVIAGTTGGGKSWRAIQVDAAGAVQWDKKTAFGQKISLNAGARLANGTLVFAASGFVADVVNKHDPLVLRVSSSGNVQKTWPFAAPQIDEDVHDICVTVGDGVVLGGQTSDTSMVFVIGADASGTKSWKFAQKNTHKLAFVLDGTSTGRGVSIACDGNGETLASWTSAGNGTDCTVVRLDAAGKLLWTAKAGDAGNQRCEDMVRATTGDYLAFGSDDKGGKGAPWLVRISPAGKVLSTTTLNAALARAKALVSLPGGGAALLGRSSSGLGDAWLAGVSGIGVLQWQRTIGAGGFDQPQGLALLANGDLAFTGTTFDKVASAPANWLVRAAAWGHPNCAGAGGCDKVSIEQCDDGAPCSLDVCDGKTGTCSHPMAADGTWCGAGKTCKQAKCGPGGG